MPIGTMIATAAGLVTAAGALTVGGMLLAGTINLVTSFGMGAIIRRIQRRRQGEQSDVAGVFGALRGGGVVPCSYIHGRWATAGSLVYRETWGKDGKTPNAFYVTVIALSDLPVTGLAGLIVNNKPVTVDLEGTPVTQGVPVPEFAVEGTDHLWIRFHDGSQTAADSYLVAKFGAHADHPWTAAAVGTGVAYLVVTALVDNELFSGWPEFLAVVDGIRLYDIREDDTAGGEGDQRFADTATHGFSENPLVAAYSILRGIAYGSQPFYGGKRIGAQSLPFDAWAAAMNECDLPVALAGGGTEPQFVAGGEITVDMPPADVLDELMTAAAGRIAESGGIYRPFVGAPGAALFAFTDDDIVVTESQEFEPFFDLGESINGIASRYISAAENWQWKDAPQRTYPALEAEDGGIRNLASIAYGRVRSPTQVQRLDDAAVKESRRQRTHVLTLPPFFGIFEPGEVGAWTSARNGYANKLFRIERADDKDNLDYRVTVKEVDPGDYDWSPADELPWSVGAPFAPRVPAQEIVGWAAEGILITHDNGQRTAGVNVEWAADVDDVVGVRIQIRLASDSTLILDATTHAWDDGAAVLTQNLASITAYEARGKYIAGSPRETIWSDWIAFTTLDARTSQAELDAALDARIREIEENLPADLLMLRQDLDTVAGAIATHASTLTSMIGRAREAIGVRHGESLAGIEEVRLVSATATEAIAAFFLDLFAVNPDTGEGHVNFRAIAQAAEDGALASVAWQVRAGQSASDEWATAALELAAFYDVTRGYYSRAQLIADAVNLVVRGVTLAGTRLPISDLPYVVPIVLGSPNTVTIDLTLQRRTYKVRLTANVTIAFPTGDGIHDFDIIFEQAGAGSHTVAWAAEWLGTAPTILATAGSLSWVACSVISMGAPNIAMAALVKSSTAGGLPTDFEIIVDAVGTTLVDLPSYNQLNIEAIGASGGSGGGGTGSGNNGGNGGDTTVTLPGFTTISAGGGRGGRGRQNGGNGGVGGTATGGNHTNTHGVAGQTGYQDESGRHGGKGGDAPNGGLGAAATNSWSAGRVGKAPGGGSSGGASNWGDKGGGGSGSGAYGRSSWTFGVGTPPAAGLQISCLVGAPGSAGDGHSPGAVGTKGRIRIWGN